MYRAKIGFSGNIIMKKNEVREIKDKKLVNDLIQAGYIEEYKSSTSKELEKENATLKEDLEKALATIEELNKRIAELPATPETSDDGTPSDDGDTSDKEDKK